MSVVNGACLDDRLEGDATRATGHSIKQAAHVTVLTKMRSADDVRRALFMADVLGLLGSSLPGFCREAMSPSTCLGISTSFSHRAPSEFWEQVVDVLMEQINDARRGVTRGVRVVPPPYTEVPLASAVKKVHACAAAFPPDKRWPTRRRSERVVDVHACYAFIPSSWNIAPTKRRVLSPCPWSSRRVGEFPCKNSQFRHNQLG